MESNETQKTNFSIKDGDNNFTFDLVNQNINLLNQNINELSKILNIEKEYKAVVQNENFEIKDLDNKEDITPEDAKKIKQFYFLISSLSDKQLKSICLKNELNFQNLLIWKKIIESYFIESAHKTVVPKTPINIARKVNSWSKCIEGNGTGIYLVSRNNIPVGFFGITKMEKNNEFEVNYVVFKDFQGKNLTRNIASIFIPKWKKDNDKERKFKLYGEVLSSNIASKRILETEKGEYCGNVPWVGDKNITVEQYILPYNAFKEEIKSQSMKKPILNNNSSIKEY